MSIQGKVALVTGSAQGIGRGIALRLASDGANLCLVDMQKDKLEKVAGEIRALGRKVTTFVADVSDRKQVFAAVDHAEKELGGFDIMVNNAGICQVCPVIEATESDLQRIIRINVLGVLWGIQAAAKKFIARNQKGKIISASSIAGHDGFPLLGAYSATKFAVRGLIQTAARELGSKGINVNAYCPGIVDTDMWTAIDDGLSAINGKPKGQNFKENCEVIALGRAEVPADVAALVSFLAGPDSDYMTGQALMIDGGMVYR